MNGADAVGGGAGAAFLLTAAVGSGIMAERLSAGNPGLALPANAIATARALFILPPRWRPFPGRISTRPGRSFTLGLVFAIFGGRRHAPGFVPARNTAASAGAVFPPRLFSPPQ